MFAHNVDDIIHRLPRAFLQIEIELLNEALKACATQELLRHTFQPVLEICRDIGNDILFGNLLLFYQDERLRAVQQRPSPSHDKSRQATKEKRPHQIPPATHDE